MSASTLMLTVAVMPGSLVDIVAENVTDAGAAALGLSVCRVYVVFDDPGDRLLSVGFGDISTTDPAGLFQHPASGDTAPAQADINADPDVQYDSYVTLGVAVVSNAVTDGTALDPDFDVVSFENGQVSGGWYNAPPTNDQGLPDGALRVLVGQLTVNTGFGLSGTLTAFANDGLTELETSFVCGQVMSCSTIADCADLDEDGVRDDNCVFWACTTGVCVATEILFADMGGQFGACDPDGAADGNDRFQALNCFAGQAADGGAYDCEVAPPAAFNVDPGGQFGSCAPDGVCDGNDAFAALNAFAGESSCSCAAGPAPDGGGASAVAVIDETTLTLRQSSKRLRPGGVVDIDVYLSAPVSDLRGYQLHLRASGGVQGELRPVDISIAPATEAHVLAGRPFWSAFNVGTQQMVAGLDEHGTATQPGYLATYSYRASKDARGTFTIDVLRDETDEAQRTFIFPTDQRDMIRIRKVAPAVIHVRPWRGN